MKQHRSIDITLCWDDGYDGDSTVTSAVTSAVMIFFASHIWYSPFDIQAEKSDGE